MSKQTTLRAALLVLVLVLCGAVAFGGSEAVESDDSGLGKFTPTEKVRADDIVPFPVNI